MYDTGEFILQHKDEKGMYLYKSTSGNLKVTKSLARAIMVKNDLKNFKISEYEDWLVPYKDKKTIVTEDGYSATGCKTIEYRVGDFKKVKVFTNIE